MRRLSVLCAALSLTVSSVAFAQDTEITPYGYFKADVVYETAQSSHGNFAMFVKPHADGDAEDGSHVTARQTRLGFNMKRDEVTGKFEFDFYGGGNEHQNGLQFRKGYIDFPLAGLRLRAGQDSDLISPLVPSTLNFTVCWGVGNIGFRRPQVRLYQSGDGPVSWGVALARNVGPDIDDNDIDDGADGLPVLQARVAFAGGDNLSLGVSGLYGISEVPAAGDDTYDSWAVSGEALLKLDGGAKVLGEVYAGSNLATYFGSILNANSVDGLASLGGWANLQLPAGDDLTLSVGAGFDSVDEDDLAGAGARSSNMVVYGNVQRVLAPGVKGGVELSWLTTEYPNAAAGMEPEPTDLRLQLSIIGSL